jgi:precorrin-8X/cobalt-precorrin-8 methylmutase
MKKMEFTNATDIEKRSFEIITELLGDRTFPPFHDPIVKRVIHTTADLEYADTLKIGDGAVEFGINAIKSGCNIVTDTKMAAAGINQRTLAMWGGQVQCFMDDSAIAEQARELNVTRASLCMEKAAGDPANQIFAIGNAPTALMKLCDLITKGIVNPALVIGVPVGFVNVVESKKALMQMDVPYIVAEGRKGGSNVAAAIVNALLYMAAGR